MKIQTSVEIYWVLTKCCE